MGDKVRGFCLNAMLMTSLQHPNIVKLHGICIQPPTLCLIEELCECDLRQYLHNNAEHLDIREKLLLALDCALAVKFLHSQSIVHMDLRAEKFFVQLLSAQQEEESGDTDFPKLLHPKVEQFRQVTVKLGDLELSEVESSAGLQNSSPTRRVVSQCRPTCGNWVAP